MHRVHIVDNFISEEDANVLIREQVSPSSAEAYPDYYKDRFGGTAFPYNPITRDLLKKYGDISNEKHKELNGFVNPIYVFKAFGSIWNPGKKGDLHLDAQDPEPWIEWSTIIYLNDEFTGGDIYFPNQDFVYKPKKYSAVFFPSAGSEYAHGITTVTGGVRHTALYMHTSLPKHADPDFLSPEDDLVWKAGESEFTRI